MGLFSTELFDFGKSYLDTEKLASKVGLGDFSPNSLSVSKFIGLPGLKIDNFLSGVARRLDVLEYGYIVDTVTQERLAFQYNVNISEAGGAEYATFQTIARSIPQYHYKGGKERTLTLPIDFTMRTETRQDVLSSIRWLQALTYPDYDGENETSFSPHPVIVIQGQLYYKDIWLAKDFNISWGEARDPISQIPSEATCTLTLMEISTGLSSKGSQEVLRI